MPTNRPLQLIKASAGSGKTYTLTKYYIELLLSPDRPQPGKPHSMRLRPAGNDDYFKHILAITFTNKATAEMKERIVTQLYELSQGRGQYIEEFKRQFQYNDFSEVTQRAADILANLLFGYTDFKVSTIDSFFQSIVRTFAMELERDYNYNIQIDDSYVNAVAVNNFLHRLGNTHKPKAKNGRDMADGWMQRMIDYSINNNKSSWNIFANNSTLLDFCKILSNEEFRKNQERINNYLADIGEGGHSGISLFIQALGQAKTQAEIDLKNLFGQSFTNLLSHHGIEPEFFKATCKYILNLTQPYPDEYKPTDTMRKLSTTSLSSTIKKAYIELVTENALADITAYAQQVINTYDLITAVDSIMKNVWLFGLMGEINNEVQNFRLETNTMLLSDSADLINTVIQSGVPFIFERTGTWIYNYMIDEFQDTSRSQYLNFKPLIDESLSGNNANLIIGDEKQSIYRFRNSDPDLIQTQIVNDFSQALEHNSLAENYRSCTRIIEFNNTLFRTLITQLTAEGAYPKLEVTYRGLEQTIPKMRLEQADQGYVQVNIVGSLEFKDKPSPNDVSEYIASTIPQYIEQIRRRGYSCGDIGILVNTRNEGNAVVSAILEYNRLVGSGAIEGQIISVASAESMLLTNSPAVNMIVNLLRFLNASIFNTEELTDSQQRQVRNQVRSQSRHLVLQEFERQLNSDVNQHLTAGQVLDACFQSEDLGITDLKSQEQIAKLFRRYQDFEKELLNQQPDAIMNLESVVHNIIHTFKLGITSTGQANFDAPFVEAFQDLVHDFCQQGNGGTFSEFLRFWENGKSTLSIETTDGGDTVQVMTIHKSKGLQFPCTIVMPINWPIVKLDKILWITREQWLNTDTDGQPFLGIKESEGKDIVPPLIPIPSGNLEHLPQFATHYARESQDSVIDNLNKTYVALTRPKAELHVFVDNIHGMGKDVETALGKMNGMLTASEITLTALPNAEQATYICPTFTFGEPIERTSEQGQSPSSELRTEPSYGNGTKLIVSLPEMDGDLRERGISMHRLMQRIHYTTDTQRALVWARSTGLLSGDKYWNEERLQHVTNLIHNAQPIKSWFRPGIHVFTERSFSGKRNKDDLNEQFHHDRPDRIIYDPTNRQVTVIDYKFGDDATTNTLAKYAHQVSNYMHLCNTYFNAPTQGYLWFVKLNRIFAITDSGHAHPIEIS